MRDDLYRCVKTQITIQNTNDRTITNHRGRNGKINKSNAINVQQVFFQQ